MAQETNIPGEGTAIQGAAVQASIIDIEQSVVTEQMVASNPYENSTAVNTLVDRWIMALPLTMASEDIDSTFTGKREDQLRAREEMRKRGIVNGANSSRVWEMLISREQYDNSGAGSVITTF